MGEQTMNDDFLTRFRKAPRREFAADLYERINIPMNQPRKFTLKRFSVAVAVCLALATALVFSPSVRAVWTYISREIGGVTYLEEDPAAGPTVTPLPESAVTTVPEDRLTLSEAREKVPFEIHLPTWVPEGFTMSSSVRISYFGDKYTPVEIIWYGNSRPLGGIQLTVGQRVNWLVDLDHLQEVQINGASAGLTGGNWNADTGEWSGDDLTLTWMLGDVMYRLSARGLPVEDLIRMAESIR
jgi:hypothetical protein